MIGVIATTPFVERKPQLNFYVDPALRDAWDEYMRPFGPRRNSTVGTDAILAFFRLPETEQRRIISQVADAELMQDVRSLVASALSPSTQSPEPEPKISESFAKPRPAPAAAAKGSKKSR